MSDATCIWPWCPALPVMDGQCAQHVHQQAFEAHKHGLEPKRAGRISDRQCDECGKQRVCTYDADDDCWLCAPCVYDLGTHKPPRLPEDEARVLAAGEGCL